jgi:hypothetical protein
VRLRLFGVALMAFAFWRVASAQPPPEGAMGQCAAYILTAGKVEAAEHELAVGSVNVGRFTLVMPTEGVAIDRLKSLLGTDVELVVRPVKCRAMERVER